MIQQNDKDMTTENKTYFTKAQRMSLLVSSQIEWIKTYSSMLNRIETKFPESEKQLILETKKRINILNTRLSILATYNV